MQSKIDALHAIHTWTLVPKTMDMNLVSGNKIKTRANSSIEHYKACLVARDFTQLHGLNYDETFSPIVKLGTIRLILMLALSPSLATKTA